MIGMIAGATLGAGTEMAAANERKKAQKRAETSAEFGGARPKRRKVAKLGKIVGQAFSNKQRALVAMAQAHQNFASMW
jgi:hypothetical protein